VTGSGWRDECPRRPSRPLPLRQARLAPAVARRFQPSAL
jgi:hypothetical protein